MTPEYRSVSKTVTEVLHELGHVLGATHMANPGCIISTSMEMDIKLKLQLHRSSLPLSFVRPILEIWRFFFSLAFLSKNNS